MPTYEYACPKCGHEFEQFQSMLDEPLKKCPKCRKPGVKRLVGVGAGLIFKGSGFYITDYKNKSGGKPDAGGPESKPSEAKPSEAKPAESKSSESKTAGSKPTETKTGTDSKPSSASSGSSSSSSNKPSSSSAKK